MEWVKWHDGEMETRNRGRKEKRIKQNKESEREMRAAVCCKAEQTTLELSATVTAEDDCW